MKLICPLFYKDEKSFDDMLIETMDSSCDLIEIRLDKCTGYSISKLKDIVCKSKKKIIYTIRTTQEGGYADLSSDEYEKMINNLFDIEDCLIDIELNQLISFSTDKYISNLNRIILSYHNFNSTPNNLDEIWNQMVDIGASIHKVACMPETKEDVLRLLISCLEHKTKAKKCAISMSELGKMSRLIGGLFESEFTFCSLSTTSAPGQYSLEEMVALMDMLDI